MYNLNGSLSKTFIKEMCLRLTKVFPEIKDQLLDILDTPISPELLPSEKDKIAQKTEDIIGPYDLHDFFLYHFVYHHLGLKKVLEIAKITFKDEYDEETIRKWLRTFVRRFFNNQFKRSCCPDGAKISEVSLSPRGDFRLPSDASGIDLSKDI
jgi:NAD+ synthase (glutamine-hydrolysing)